MNFKGLHPGIKISSLIVTNTEFHWYNLVINICEKAYTTEDIITFTLINPVKPNLNDSIRLTDEVELSINGNSDRRFQSYTIGDCVNGVWVTYSIATYGDLNEFLTTKIEDKQLSQLEQPHIRMLE
jgi:hypothetical protein